MIERKSFPATFTSRPAWLLGAVLLAASSVVSLAETPAGSDRTTERQNVMGETAPVPAKGLPEDDYYARRAKSRLVEDAAIAAKQISLQAAYPGHNVVMCEAGCYGRASRIVQFAPKVATNIESSRALEPSSAALPGPEATTASKSAVTQPLPPSGQADDIRCVAGCYGQAKSYLTASPVSVEATARAEADALMHGTSAAPDRGRDRRSGASGAEARRWMTTSTKIGEPQQRSAARSEDPAKQKKRTTVLRSQRVRANPSGEWFQQINADRISRTR